MCRRGEGILLTHAEQQQPRSANKLMMGEARAWTSASPSHPAIPVMQHWMFLCSLPVTFQKLESLKTYSAESCRACRGSQLLQLNRGLSWEGSRRSSCSTPESVRSDFGVVACIPSPASLHLLLCPLSSPQGLFFPFQTDVQSHMLFPSLLPLSSASEK